MSSRLNQNNGKDDKEHLEQDSHIINDVSETDSLVNIDIHDEVNLKSRNIEKRDKNKEGMSYLQIGVWINVVLYFFIAFLIIIYQ